MTVNPEQPVLDAIAELVDWQLEEGRRRGDGPAATGTADDLRQGALVVDIWEPRCSCCLDRTDVHAENMRRWWGGILSTAEILGTPDVFSAGELRADLEALQGDSSSTPGIDTINPANGEQPRR